MGRPSVVAVSGREPKSVSTVGERGSGVYTGVECGAGGRGPGCVGGPYLLCGNGPLPMKRVLLGGGDRGSMLVGMGTGVLVRDMSSMNSIVCLDGSLLRRDWFDRDVFRLSPFDDVRGAAERLT